MTGRTASTSLVISGGTARGAYAAGVVVGLHRANPQAVANLRVLSGTSTGALIVPMLALAIEGDARALDDLVSMYSKSSEAVWHVKPKNRLLGALAHVIGLGDPDREFAADLVENALTTGACLDTSPLREVVSTYMTSKRFDLLRRAFAERGREVIVSCVCAQTGDLVRFRTGDEHLDLGTFRKAIYASCMQPVFMPLEPIDYAYAEREPGDIQWNGVHEYMDGGIRDVVPVYAAWRAGATRALAISVSGGTGLAPRSFIGSEHIPDLIVRVGVEILDQQVANDDLQQARYFATIGRLIDSLGKKGVDVTALSSELALLNADENDRLRGGQVFDDYFEHRPGPEVHLEEKLVWPDKGLLPSIQAGLAAVNARVGSDMIDFLRGGPSPRVRAAQGQVAT